MQADGTWPLGRNAGDVNVIRIWDKARHRTLSQQDDATANQFNVFISSTIRRQPHVVAFFQNSFHHSDDAPASVIMDWRPLSGKPDDRVQRQAFIRRLVDEVSCIAAWIATKVLRQKEC